MTANSSKSKPTAIKYQNIREAAKAATAKYKGPKVSVEAMSDAWGDGVAEVKVPLKSKDPLHGLTLEAILTALVKRRGWEYMGKKVRVRCFNVDPSISSSLRFLRKTPWAREKVERMYLAIPRPKPANPRV